MLSKYTEFSGTSVNGFCEKVVSAASAVLAMANAEQQRLARRRIFMRERGEEEGDSCLAVLCDSGNKQSLQYTACVLQSLISRLASEKSLTLTIRVRPNARITKLTAVLEDGSLKIDVHAAPEDGEANQELMRYVAELFSVPRACVEFLAGQRSRVKAVRIRRS